jgi:superfamily II DNA or RNA helicase
MKAILRSYQEEAVSAFLAAPGGKGFVKAFTGSGKTLVALAAVERLAAGEPEFAALIITPTRDLVEQWRVVILEEGLGHLRIDVITYAAAAKRMGGVGDDPSTWWFGQYNLIVFDEGHHLEEGDQWRLLLFAADNVPHALGLSATPPEKEGSLTLRVMPIVATRTYQEGLDEGYAAPVTVYPIGVQLTPPERERYNALTAMIREMTSLYGDDYHSRPYARLPGPTFMPAFGREMEGTIWGATITQERRFLVANSAAKIDKLVKTLRAIIASGDASPIFCWSEYNQTLEAAHARLLAEGIASNFIHSKVPKKERRARWAEWGRSFQVLLLGKLGEEGVNRVDAANGVVFAGSKTSRQSIQRLGRLLRPAPGKVAKLRILYCERTMEEKLVYLFDRITEEG